MNRTLKDATFKRYHYQTHEQFKEDLQLFLATDNFARRLKTLKGLTPYEYIFKCWRNQKERFKLDPNHYTLELNT